MKLISARFILPVTHEPIPDGAVVIDQGKIIAFGPAKALAKRFPNAVKEEFPDACLMPGLVNVDTHLEFLSVEEPRHDNLVDWIIANLECQNRITPEVRRHNLSDGIGRLVRSGTTSVGDTGSYVGSLKELQTPPIRLTLFPEILTSAGETVSDRYQTALGIVDEILAKKNDRLSAGIAPYAPFMISRPLLKIIAQQARELKIPVKIHVAESFAEMQFFYESTGEIAEKLFPHLGWTDPLPPPHRRTPIEYLESIGFLEGGPILVGCLHLSENDIKLIKKGNAKVVWRPRAQKILNLGETPIAKLKEAKIPIGLGTDGTGSRHSLSLWDEMRAIGGMIPPDELLRIATLGGAEVLGRGGEIGSIDIGKRADLIAVRVPSSLKIKDLASHLVSQTTDHDLLGFFVDGEKIGT